MARRRRPLTMRCEQRREQRATRLEAVVPCHDTQTHRLHTAMPPPPTHPPTPTRDPLTPMQRCRAADKSAQGRRAGNGGRPRRERCRGPPLLPAAPAGPATAAAACPGDARMRPAIRQAPAAARLGGVVRARGSSPMLLAAALAARRVVAAHAAHAHSTPNGAPVEEQAVGAGRHRPPTPAGPQRAWDVPGAMAKAARVSAAAAGAAARRRSPPLAAAHRRPRPPAPAPGNPLPRPVHDRLPEHLTRGRRVLVVGDIHGCYDELQVGAGRALASAARRPVTCWVLAGGCAAARAWAPSHCWRCPARAPCLPGTAGQVRLQRG